MMPQTRLWLPAASRSEAEAVITAVMRRWTKDWFAAADQFGVSATPASALRKQAWRGGNDVLAGCESGMATRLGAALCAGMADIENRRDQAILEKVGDAALQELATLLGAPAGSQAVDEQTVPGWASHCFIVTAGNRQWTLGLALGEEALTALRRSQAGATSTPRVGKIFQSLDNEECRLGLHLGRAKLEAADLAALGPGDVIVFDQSARAALPLLVEGHPAEGGRAKIEPGETTLEVAIAASPSIILKETELT